MKRHALIFSLALAVFAAVTLNGAGLIVVNEAHWLPDRDPNPPLVIPPHWPLHPHPHRPTPPPPLFRPHVFAPLQLQSCTAAVSIQDQVATTTLEQVFYNPNTRDIEGTFLFPVPHGAQLDKFAMEIDGNPVEAELLDADKARRLYTDIVRKAKDPALLEYDGQDLFRARLFPIEAGDTKRVTLRYTQVLAMDNGMVGYTLPLDAAKYSSTPTESLAVNMTLETQRPLRTLYSPTHDVEITHQGARKATVGYECSEPTSSADLTLYFSTDTDPVGLNLMTYRASDDEDGYFLLLASPGVDIEDEQIMPKDVAFVIDTSGSMAGKKLRQAQKALEFCVENLNAEDRFEIIRFSTEAESLFGGFESAAPDNREKAIDFVEQFKAIGGTAIDEALKSALRLSSAPIDDDKPTGNRPFVIIFLTDGLPTVGVTSEKQILDHVEDRCNGAVRIFCFGVGTDVNTRLLDKITEHTRATSQYVLPDEDLEIKVSSFYSKIKDPVLANPLIRFEGKPRVSRLHPSDLPDLFRGEQLVLVGRYSGSGRTAIVLEGAVNGKNRVFERQESFPRKTRTHDFIPRLWANRRVGYLLDQIRLHGEDKELKDEIVDLARQYGIVTPYTAYLILEDEERRGVPTTVQSLPELQQDAGLRVALQGYEKGYLRDVSGDLAVNAARANSSIRHAANLAASQQSLHDAVDQLRLAPSLASSGGAAATQGSRPSTTDATSAWNPQMQFVGGRNFYLNDGRWIDAQVQKLPEAKRVELKFGSDDYFKFATAHPAAGPWLAHGANVEFVLDGAIYAIHE